MLVSVSETAAEQAAVASPVAAAVSAVPMDQLRAAFVTATARSFRRTSMFKPAETLPRDLPCRQYVRAAALERSWPR